MSNPDARILAIDDDPDVLQLVEQIDGDYLNVVGLPASLLVRLLADRFAGVYGFG